MITCPRCGDTFETRYDLRAHCILIPEEVVYGQEGTHGRFEFLCPKALGPAILEALVGAGLLEDLIEWLGGRPSKEADHSAVIVGDGGGSSGR